MQLLTVTVVLGIGLVPLAIAVFLLLRADQAAERRRGVLTSLVTAGAVLACDRLLPIEPGFGGILSALDPLWLPALVAAGFAVLIGRSRRNAFAGAAIGVFLTDLYALIVQLRLGVAAPQLHLGSAGTLDALTLSAMLALLLAEAVGETRERLHRLQTQPQRASRFLRPYGFRPDGRVAGAALLLAFVAWSLVADANGAYSAAHVHGDAKTPYWMVDTDRRVIAAFSHPLYLGDRYLDPSDQWFQVTALQGRTALVERLDAAGVSEVPGVPGGHRSGLNRPYGFALAAATRERPTGLIHRLNNLDPPRAPARRGTSRSTAADEDGPLIVILHTHNAESYVTSDGAAFTQGLGGVHRVGRALAEALREHGYRVIHDESVHLPHDRGAYRRSRRTIARHLAKQPLMVIDIHRDALSNEHYAHEIDGEGVTQVRLVVGRQNPNLRQNLAFARELKAVGDDLYPGLVKGIYVGRGNYNQDLGPRTILFEMGSHTNARESAERAAVYVAEIIHAWHRQALAERAP